jgi:hypothetical protein
MPFLLVFCLVSPSQFDQRLGCQCSPVTAHRPNSKCPHLEAGEELRVNDQITNKQKRESPTLRRAHDGGGVDESPRVREGRRGRGGNRREQGRRARRSRPAWERRPARVGAAGAPKARSRGPQPSLELCYQILAIGQIRRVSPLVSGGVTVEHIGVSQVPQSLPVLLLAKSSFQDRLGRRQPESQSQSLVLHSSHTGNASDTDRPSG